MWSKSNIRSFGYNHFVSLVDADETMCIINVNMIPIGYCDELSKNVPIEIDLTEDMNETKFADEGYLEKDYDMKKQINEKAGKNSDYWLCTSCHKEVYSKSNVYLFDILRYNFDHETVRNVLDKTICCCNDKGEEFICRF